MPEVNILQRHGARYPNAEDGAQYSDAVERLASAHKFTDKRLKFLKGYEYGLGEEDLVPFGAMQTFEAGQVAFQRYGHLVDKDNIPFVRAAGASRVVATAQNWTVGFAAASNQRIQPYVNVIISEEVNNTLNEDCPAAGLGEAQVDIWKSVFGPSMAARLNEAAPGAALNYTDVYNVMAMCPFESVAGESESAFCALFSSEDWDAFAYAGDVEKYYRTGYGNRLGPIQGVGYVNELLARLTGAPVHDRTTHNATLEFPLGRAFYADFTHEHLMVAVYAALGLFDVSGAPVDPRGPGGRAGNAEWVASRMVPFSARMVTERLSCREDDEGAGGEFVRVVVNEEVQRLGFCAEQEGEGQMCTLEAFVESQGYARRSGDGDFERCYASEQTMR